MSQPLEVNPKFLGIRFDKNLTFKNQVSYLNDSCIKRLNILKILSNKKWGLTTKTLTQVYNSLIRSLLEYSRIIYPRLSYTNLDLIEKIQYKCLKIIHKKTKYESNSIIKELPDYLSVKDRFDNLNVKYLQKCLDNKNELIIRLYDDYLSYSNGRDLKNETLFCKYKNLIWKKNAILNVNDSEIIPNNNN